MPSLVGSEMCIRDRIRCNRFKFNRSVAPIHGPTALGYPPISVRDITGWRDYDLCTELAIFRTPRCGDTSLPGPSTLVTAAVCVPLFPKVVACNSRSLLRSSAILDMCWWIRVIYFAAGPFLSFYWSSTSAKYLHQVHPPPTEKTERGPAVRYQANTGYVVHIPDT